MWFCFILLLGRRPWGSKNTQCSLRIFLVINLWRWFCYRYHLEDRISLGKSRFHSVTKPAMVAQCQAYPGCLLWYLQFVAVYTCSLLPDLILIRWWLILKLRFFCVFCGQQLSPQVVLRSIILILMLSPQWFMPGCWGTTGASASRFGQMSFRRIVPWVPLSWRVAQREAAAAMTVDHWLHDG